MLFRSQAQCIRRSGDGLTRIKRSEPAISAALHARPQPARFSSKSERFFIPAFKVEGHGEQSIYHADAIDRLRAALLRPATGRIPETELEITGAVVRRAAAP